MARKKQTILQGPTITIPRSANVYSQAPIQQKEYGNKHWIFEIFDEKPRTLWECIREFCVGFVIGWVLMDWFWESRRKRRQVYLNMLGK